MIDNSLFYLSPHPNLLPLKGVLKRVPEGEGITLNMDLCDLMSSISSNTLRFHKISDLLCITNMLTGQQ